MSRSEIENALLDLNQLVIDGQLLEAFERYYHDDVIMQENQNVPVVGKEQNRKREQEFLSNVSEFRSATVKGLGVGENISFVEWSYDYTHREWGTRNYTQVSVQRWKNGRIIREQFFYGS